MNEDERIETMLARIGKLEERERERDELILGYIRADMAAPWMVSAKRLEAFLMRELK
jgi:hypothetical protein